jgi:phosphomevalonate decarboxylase
MKATAKAHPIQGIVKYHGMRDEALRHPYHDSISLCTAPSHTKTTAAFDRNRDADEYVVDGESVEGSGAERIRSVVDEVRERAGVDHRVRVVSENSFRTNIGFGSSASGFAALATALTAAAGLDLSRPEISAVARRGSASAARAVTGAYSHLRTGVDDRDCRSERIDVADELEEDVRVVAGMVPSYKETAAAHREAARSHMFEGRLAHIHEQVATARGELRAGNFDAVFELAEHDSLSLAATTMTGPAGWVYWQPRTLEVFNAVRELRRETDLPVYFSVDTGASVYVNTTAEHVDRVEATVADCGVETRVWTVGGPARVLDESGALF